MNTSVIQHFSQTVNLAPESLAIDTLILLMEQRRLGAETFAAVTGPDAGFPEGTVSGPVKVSELKCLCRISKKKGYLLHPGYNFMDGP